MEHRETEQYIPISVSARHVHLDQVTFRQLFGENAEPTVKKELAAPGDFLCNERVDLVGPRGVIRNVAILGPFRKKPQVEISITDSYTLGTKFDVRNSGELEHSAPIALRSPLAEVSLQEGMIAAQRHVHMKPEQAAAFGVKDRDIVNVLVETERSLVFRNVLVRVDPSYILVMHIDTDEANAGEIASEGDKGYIVNCTLS